MASVAPRPPTPLVERPIPLRLPASEPPRLLVVIDTEEEFAWSEPANRSATSVGAIAHVGRLEEVFAPYGIVPAYVADWPVLSQRKASDSLAELRAAGRAEIGTHLHPWVSPPFDEALTPANTYAGNLPRSLEREKLARLTDLAAEVFGARPTMYKAGRYGVGANTAAILEELGYEIDLSLCPTLDSSADGGPDYSAYACEPFVFGTDRALVEFPLTAAFVGALGESGAAWYRAATRPVLAPLRLPAFLARARLVDRLVLSPEGFTPSEHRRLVQALLDRGARVFTWSFHSPSVVPGATPYVRNDADLRRFLDSFRRFFDWFLGEVGGRVATHGALALELTTRAAETADTPARP